MTGPRRGVLDRHRHAVQWPVTHGEFARPTASFVGPHVDEAIQTRLNLLDPRQRGLDEIDGTHRAFVEKATLIGDREEVEPHANQPRMRSA